MDNNNSNNTYSIDNVNEQQEINFEHQINNTLKQDFTIYWLFDNIGYFLLILPLIIIIAVLFSIENIYFQDESTIGIFDLFFNQLLNIIAIILLAKVIPSLMKAFIQERELLRIRNNNSNLLNVKLSKYETFGFLGGCIGYIIIQIIIELCRLRKNGIGVLYPDIPLSYFFLIANRLEGLIIIALFVTNVSLLVIFSFKLNNEIKVLRFTDLDLQVSNFDNSGGFKNFRNNILWQAILPTIPIIGFILLILLDVLFNLHITDVSVPVYSTPITIVKITDIVIIIILTIVVPIISLFVFYIPIQTKIRNKIREFKTKKIKSILEERFKILEEVTSNPLDHTEEKQKVLDLYSSLINEYEQLDYPIFDKKSGLALVIINLSPLVIWIIQKIIENYI